ESWYIEDNIRTYAGDPDAVPISRGPFGDVLAGAGIDWGKNFMESMNGLIYGHLPGLTMRVGERVRWYIMASTNFEPHAPHWHGNTVTIRQMRTDVAEILPMGMTTAEMVPDNPGIWLFHCHVSYHLMAGMQAVYTVEPALVASQ
ncbi:MAG: multicopper oxidase domain-containing protein, partial [Acidimicrobiia bacterium]